MKIGKPVESQVRHALATARLYELCFHDELHSRMSKEVHNLIDVRLWDKIIETVSVIAKMEEWIYDNKRL